MAVRGDSIFAYSISPCIKVILRFDKLRGGGVVTGGGGNRASRKDVMSEL